MIKKFIRVIKKDQNKLIYSIGLAITVVALPYILKFSDYPVSTQTSDWGAFGSYVGGILSPLFAIGSLYYVVKTFRQQSFETTFNLLLEQHNNLADALSKKRTTENSDSSPTSPIEDVLNELGDCWLSADAHRKKSLNDNYDVHKYVRVVYQILMFIDENCPSDKRKYSRIFRSFISNDLNLILAMNCAQLDSNEQIVFIKYKYLIEKYHLLEHLIILDLAENTKLFSSPKLTNLLVIAGIFTPSAFGDGENIRKALESAFEDYHLSLSTQLYQISNNIKCHKKNNRFYNENLEKLSDLLEEHEKLSKGASKELVDLNRKCLNLIKHAVGLTENKKIPENFRKTLSDIEISFKNIISDGCKQLENVSFYDHYQLELEISKFESTNPLNQFLDGIMHAVSEELKSVEFEIDNTIKNTSSRV
ncbi:hypothetical protein OTK51_04455 [Vibrio scophthalmi]|uniref:putative phage abortive infection protein n=1 Tax=Vibrio scophthalmi TaxID=45658 RepID=UPI0022833E23|nr:hypothetical protein [Vibrio scophthalmi]